MLAAHAATGDLMKILLAQHEIEMAAQVGLRRQLEALQRNLPDRHGYNGRDGWTVHIEGAAGELAVAKTLGRFWNGSVNTFHNGGDVGKIQVRTRSKDDYDLIVREDDRDGDYFVLVTGCIPSFEVRGWILGTDAKRPEWLQTHGGREAAYFVPAAALTPFRQTGR